MCLEVHWRDWAGVTSEAPSSTLNPLPSALVPLEYGVFLAGQKPVLPSCC